MKSLVPAILILWASCLNGFSQYITIIEYKTPCTEIHKAARDGDLNKVMDLVEGGANLKKSCHQMNLLQEAALAGQDHVVKYLLLQQGMDPNAKAINGVVSSL